MKIYHNRILQCVFAFLIGWNLNVVGVYPNNWHGWVIILSVWVLVTLVRDEEQEECAQSKE